MRVPFVDLSTQHRQVQSDIEIGWRRVTTNLAFVLGVELLEFERAYAEFCGMNHCIGVANGGDALEVALRALEIKVGDEVIVPANSYTATAMSVLRVGATPIFCDVDTETLLIDPESFEKAIGPNTRAVIPVHLFGQVAPMKQICDIAKRRKLKVIEDAAQSQGAMQDGQSAGSFGDITATSFYPGKNLGAYGDAGGILTNDSALATKVMKIRNYGGLIKYEHEEFGLNSRLDEIQAVVLIEKLKHLARWNQERSEIAVRYSEHLSEVTNIKLPVSTPQNSHVWHLYVVQVNDRDKVIKEFENSDIGYGIHYPEPIHKQKAFSHLATPRVSLEVSERAAERILSLPIYPGLKLEQQMMVIETLRSALL